jgi:Tfp pilus assembly protein PilX
MRSNSICTVDNTVELQPVETTSAGRGSRVRGNNEEGTAALTAVLILALLAMFAAASLSRVTTEAVVMSNDYSNTQAFYAAQASLETMSRNFNNVFNVRLSPSDTDLDNIRNAEPDIPSFTFNQNIVRDGTQEQVLIEEGSFAGLYSSRDPWRLESTATYGSGAQVQLTRTFFNHRIPIFQFGIFYNDDMEIHPGPHFAFGGRVHSNGNLFMMAGGGGLDFDSRVTAAGEVVRNTARNGLSRGQAGWSWDGAVRIKDDKGAWQNLAFGKGSVDLGPDWKGADPDLPDGAQNPNWDNDSKLFGGNLKARQRPLRLPLQVSNKDNPDRDKADPIQLIKRGENDDEEILRNSRYFNKPGIRISLSDRQDKLPNGGGVRLDGKSDGSGADADAGTARGYVPLAMKDGYQATRLNAYRLYLGNSYDTAATGKKRQTWIKVEMVNLDNTNAPFSVDITKDFLSTGFTEKGTQLGLNNDDRAILKLQRYAIPGPPVKVPAGDLGNLNTNPAFTQINDPRGGTKPVYTYNAAGGFSYVAPNNLLPATNNAYGTDPSDVGATLESAHEVQVLVGAEVKRVVPFPIEIYDPREGLFSVNLPAAGAPSWQWLYTGTSPGVNLLTNYKVPVTGVMSLIDIDMANLGRFLRGDWNAVLPDNAALTGGRLTSTFIPEDHGWIIYVSDRRGDADNDGEYDMEEIFVNPDGTPDEAAGAVPGSAEDANHNGRLDVDYVWESARYTSSVETDVAAVFDHQTFRRGVRLINGATLFGTNTQGYSIASENGVYVLGNYNSTGVVQPIGNPSGPAAYLGLETPCSIASDGVAFLSTSWNDGKSFRSPFQFGFRTVPAAGQTTVRAALLMGDPMSKLMSAPNQGGGDACLSGGVHNFLRFLENWGTSFNYCGSLINLFNSRVNNGSHKNGGGVYSPPTRNWVFDTSFRDADRLPPGTPFFQFVQMTGFRQTVRQLN